MKERKVKLYLAQAMSGLETSTLVEKSKIAREYFKAAGFDVFCPVEKENIKASKGKKLQATKKELLLYWPTDKLGIAWSDALIHLTPQLRSDGAWHETGYERYYWWRPVIHIYPPGKLPDPASVSYLEDDAVVDSFEEAVEWCYRNIGTRRKRLSWKIKLLNRCIIKATADRIKWCFDWV